MPSELLTPVEVTIDDLVPVMAGPDLVDVTLVYTVRYVDITGTTIATRQASISSFGLMTAEQQAFITQLSQGIKQALHVAIVGE